MPESGPLSRQDEPITHLIICRAADADCEGANAQAKIGAISEPDKATLDDYRAGIIDLFRKGFGREPERVGVAVLPWVGELDDDSERDDDD